MMKKCIGKLEDFDGLQPCIAVSKVLGIILEFPESRIVGLNLIAKTFPNGFPPFDSIDKSNNLGGYLSNGENTGCGAERIRHCARQTL